MTKSVLVVNLMPTKRTTERQLLRLLKPEQNDLSVQFLYMESHTPKHESLDYLREHYVTLASIHQQTFDGMIVTGAPVELLPFEAIDYIAELRALFRWAEQHVKRHLTICWSAQAALKYGYDIDIVPYADKLFGVYPYRARETNHPLLKGLADPHPVPQSRHTGIDVEHVQATPALQILTANAQYGPNVIATADGRTLFILGHLEYERDTLADEYRRDIDKGIERRVPAHYYPNDDPTLTPDYAWDTTAQTLYQNWINLL